MPTTVTRTTDLRTRRATGVSTDAITDAGTSRIKGHRCRAREMSIRLTRRSTIIPIVASTGALTV